MTQSGGGDKPVDERDELVGDDVAAADGVAADGADGEGDDVDGEGDDVDGESNGEDDDVEGDDGEQDGDEEDGEGDDEGEGDEDEGEGDEDDGSLVEIGTVSKAHGVRGEVLVVLIDPTSTTLEDVETVWLGDTRHTVNQARPIGGAYLLALEGLTDRDAAAALRGRSVSVARSAIVLDDQQILYADLIGCRCELPDGTAWGTIVAIELGPQDRLVVHHDHKLDGTPGDVERLVPFVDAIIASIDIEAGRVIITPPEGMPEEPR